MTTGHRLLTNILALLFSSSSGSSMQRSHSITNSAGVGTRWELVETAAKVQKTEDAEAIATMLPTNPCPCEEEWMCRPLSPQPGLREEVFAFPAYAARHFSDVCCWRAGVNGLPKCGCFAAVGIIRIPTSSIRAASTAPTAASGTCSTGQRSPRSCLSQTWI